MTNPATNVASAVTAATERLPAWEDPTVLFYSFPSKKNPMFGRGHQPGLGCPEGLTYGDVDASITAADRTGVPSPYVCFSTRGGGRIIKLRRAKTA